MLNSLFGKKKDESDESSLANSAGPLAARLGMGKEPEGYALFRQGIDELDAFYSVFLHQDYRGFLLQLAREEDEQFREEQNKRYEFVIMNLNLQRARARALLFSRAHASIFLPRKSILDLRGEEFKKRAQAVFPNRLIRLHERIIEEGDSLWSGEKLLAILLQDIPFACPEYFELLMILFHRGEKLPVEILFDLNLPVPGLREGLPTDFFNFLRRRFIQAASIEGAEFVRQWALLIRSRPRPQLHPHMEPYLQFGTFHQDFLRHRSSPSPATDLEGASNNGSSHPTLPTEVLPGPASPDDSPPNPNRQAFSF